MFERQRMLIAPFFLTLTRSHIQKSEFLLFYFLNMGLGTIAEARLNWGSMLGTVTLEDVTD